MTNQKILFLLTFMVIAKPFGAMGALGDDLRHRVPPVPPPLKIDNIKPAVELVCKAAVTRAILRKPETSENVSGYFREIGRIFAGMETNANFSAEYLVAQMEQIPPPLDAEQYVYDVKHLLMILYRLAYDERNKAEGTPAEWMQKVCLLFKNAVSNGLKDAGKIGV